jgi:hypothetical protein
VRRKSKKCLQLRQILKAPGADLCYRVSGSGPILLMIYSGNGEAGVFDTCTKFK